MPYYNRDPKKDHNFDNHPSVCITGNGCQGQSKQSSTIPSPAHAPKYPAMPGSEAHHHRGCPSHPPAGTRSAPSPGHFSQALQMGSSEGRLWVVPLPSSNKGPTCKVALLMAQDTSLIRIQQVSRCRHGVQMNPKRARKQNRRSQPLYVSKPLNLRG